MKSHLSENVDLLGLGLANVGPSIPETDKAVSVSKNDRLLGALDNLWAEPLVRVCWHGIHLSRKKRG